MSHGITVVIPNWNGAARLSRLLDSLRIQTLKAAEILVVDNGSGDNSMTVAQQAGAQFLALDKNYGFARAVNTGISSTQSSAIAILNNDVTLEPACLERLNTALTTHSFAAPKILLASNPTRLDGSFDLTSRGFCSWRAGNGSDASLPVWNRGTVIQSAPLTAALFRRSVFEKIGLLDEQFGSYLEDVDLGIRCAAAGLTGWYEPSAVAFHEGSATLGAWKPATVQLIARNQTLLARKYGYPSGTWPVLTGQLAWGLLALRHLSASAWLKGKIEGYRQSVDRFQMPADLSKILSNQERSIRNLQRESGSRDLYWSLYFALTGGSNS